MTPASPVETLRHQIISQMVASVAVSKIDSYLQTRGWYIWGFTGQGLLLYHWYGKLPRTGQLGPCTTMDALRQTAAWLLDASATKAGAHAHQRRQGRLS